MSAMMRVERLERISGRYCFLAIQLLSKAVQLIEGVQAQRRQQLIATYPQLQLGQSNEHLLLRDVGL